MDISPLSAAQQTQTSSAVSQLTQNFDTFLTLLTTQLRNQDPLEPLDTEKFTEQLVQFASVEQSIQTNQNLEALIALQTASAGENALAMVGRVATVKADAATLDADGARWRYELPTDAEKIAIQVLDARGAVVANLQGPVGAGAHDILWNGAADSGGVAAPGVYRLAVAAVGRDGAPIESGVTTRGPVDAVAFEDGGPLIEIAGQRFSLDLVSRIDAEF